MSPKAKTKRLFKVASEYNVSTSSIVDSLSDEGFEIANKPNSKITPDMHAVLEEEYGTDKANSEKHRKAKEDYENRRSKMRASQNDSVSVDDILEPIDEEEDQEDDMPLQPQDESDEVAGLEPQDDVDDTEEQGEELPLAPEEDEVGEEEDVSEPEEVEQEDSDAEEEIEEEPAAEEAPEEEKEEVQEAAEDTSEEEKEVAEEEKEIEDESADEDTDDIESEDKDDSEDAEESEDHESDEQEEEPELDEAEGSDDSEEVEDDQEATTDEEDTTDDSKDKTDKKKEGKEKGVIRGRAGRLKGTKVVGKVQVDDSKPKRRKKRKRKKDRKNKKSKKKSKKKKKNKKKKRKKRHNRVDDNDVEKNLQETLNQMKSSETVGSKRQKRRRERKKEREEEQQRQAELEELQEDIIEATEFITVSDLADLMGVQANEVITTCMNLGQMVSINQRLDASTMELVAEEYGYEIEFVDADEGIEEIELEDDDPEDLEPRAPIITVMGHVDHGKTSLLDYIRKSQVAEGEAGGITQHVGAYEVETDDGRPITFLDTPGHEAFTAMRSRGAQATDIVILVVAADDAVMPQTIEAINHSQAAGVSMIVAINKMDKPGAKPDKIKQQLAEHDVIVEEYGGENQAAEVSAKTGEGIPDLLDKVLIESELMELQANPNRNADGVVLEARIDKGKGTVANILVQNGTLEVGDSFVAGPCFGRVRAMENELGNRIENAGPSEPLQLTGIDEVPKAGDKLVVLADEKKAKDIASQRKQIRREQELRQSNHVSLDDLSRRLALGEIDDLNLIIKADVDGSIEALSGALQKLSNDEVSVNVIHTGAGAITESDVLLASASDAIIIGFQVRPTATARSVSEEEEIDIRLFSVIYDAVDEVKDAMEGMLSPEISEQLYGNAEVRKTFNVSSIGTIAGCYVTEGKINRNNPVRIIRDGVVIYDGEIDSLKRMKDDVKEVNTGYECGISIINYNDIKVGDVIENYEVIEEKRKLEDVEGSND